jgi:hypothetical protein
LARHFVLLFSVTSFLFPCKKQVYMLPHEMRTVRGGTSACIAIFTQQSRASL